MGARGLKIKDFTMSQPTNTESIPEHLRQFVASQNPSLYTAMDHSSWRYILRVSRKFFAEHAHRKYLDGLEETGIATERIPLISEMDQKLSQFGWRAVAVVGFIPPNAFLEFLSLGILPIACDMRRLENLAYTPAPDIVHEAAGHAPILADTNYANYLLNYGELARKVIFSDKDIEVYEAIRNLSDIKEDPASSSEEIKKAQLKLDQALASVEEVSEATLLSRMGWWSFEYGLVGDLKKPRIYGAGLLSSVGESYHCLSSKVKKIPMSLDCINVSYDITKPQPQLFVTPDFSTLNKVLNEFSELMAFQCGGLEALQKARRAQTVTTTVLDSGIQISGKLVQVDLDTRGKPSYLRFEGPTQLAFSDLELPNQGADYHKHGFSTPLGKLCGLNKTAADLHIQEIRKLNGKFQFESGIIVEGHYQSNVQKGGKNLILTFNQCTVRHGDKILFKPEWGTFDMACGESVVSVFGGAADRVRYLHTTGGYQQRPNRQKTNLTKENLELNKLYAKVRQLRESKEVALQDLTVIHDELEKHYSQDWLLRLELLELNSQYNLRAPWEKNIRNQLKVIAKTSNDKNEMILRGLDLIKDN